MPLLLVEGAHGEDLYSSVPEDLPSVLQARAQGLQNIKRWVAQHNADRTAAPMSNAADIFDLKFALGGYTSMFNDTFAGSNSSRTITGLQATAA